MFVAVNWTCSSSWRPVKVLVDTPGEKARELSLSLVSWSVKCHPLTHFTGLSLSSSSQFFYINNLKDVYISLKRNRTSWKQPFQPSTRTVKGGKTPIETCRSDDRMVGNIGSKFLLFTVQSFQRKTWSAVGIPVLFLFFSFFFFPRVCQNLDQSCLWELLCRKSLRGFGFRCFELFKLIYRKTTNKNRSCKSNMSNS